MLIAHNLIDDPSAKCWMAVVCHDIPDARAMKGEIWKRTQPEPSYGTHIMGLSLHETLKQFGIIEPYILPNKKDTFYIPYLKDLIPFCSEKMQSYLINMLVRMSIDRRIGKRLP